MHGRVIRIEFLQGNRNKKGQEDAGKDQRIIFASERN